MQFAILIKVIIVSLICICCGCSSDNSIDFEYCLEKCLGDHCNEASKEADNADSITCTIVVGGGGHSQEITHTFSSMDSYSVNTCKAWEFIRSTSGNCHFTIYNQSDLVGEHVTLGTGLQARIRAGENGIRYKDDGGENIWKIRSIKIEPALSTACYVNIGGNGIRMNYFPGEYEHIPAMDKLTYFVGGNCTGQIWNDSMFGVNDAHNRFNSIHTNTTSAQEGKTLSVFSPNFRVRSMKIYDWKSINCTSITSENKDFGRCLPYTILDDNIFTDDAARDLDQDGLVDYYEDILADEFRPVVLNDSDENATKENAYIDIMGNTVIEPVTIFQVRKEGSNSDLVRIVYMQLWWMDIQRSFFCSGHFGDTQQGSVILRTLPSEYGQLSGKFWYIYATASDGSLITSDMTRKIDPKSSSHDEMDDNEILLFEPVEEQEQREKMVPSDSETFLSDDDELKNNSYGSLSAYEKDYDIIQSYEEFEYDEGSQKTRIMAGWTGKYNDFIWEQGDTFLRAPAFEAIDGNSMFDIKHVVFYYSKGKHHMYQDSGWSGVKEKYCKNITGRVNGRGEQHSPPLPRRALSVHASLGAGDRYDYTNVSSRDHYSGFTNSLLYLGYPHYKVWEDKCFRSDRARSINRAFFCSNNLNRECCLENEPDCKVRSRWACE